MSAGQKRSTPPSELRLKTAAPSKGADTIHALNDVHVDDVRGATGAMLEALGDTAGQTASEAEILQATMYQAYAELELLQRHLSRGPDEAWAQLLSGIRARMRLAAEFSEALSKIVTESEVQS